MIVTDISIATEQRFHDLLIDLHLCLREHQRALAEEGLVAEMGALFHMMRQVQTGHSTVQDILAGRGLSALLRMRDRVGLALEKRQATTGMVEAREVADQAMSGQAQSVRAVGAALDVFLCAVGHVGSCQANQ